MKKNIVAIVLVGIIVLPIYGCGNKRKALEESLEAVETMLEESEETYSTPEQVEVQQTEDEESAEPVYIIEPELTQDDTYEMRDWEAAYVEYIESVEYAPYNKYALIYVDEDDIPELVICTGTVATACTVLTFHDGEVDALQTWSLQCNYIEKQNLYWDAGGQMGEYFDHIYTIENGKWVHVEGGEYIAKLDEDGLITEEYDYAWEGEAVPKDTYYENLHAVYDIEENQNVGSEQYVKLDEMLFRLQTGKYDSVMVVAKENWFYPDDGSLACWYEYEYDNVGNRIKEACYNVDDGIYERKEYEYDNAGKLTKETTQHGADGKIYWYEYEYDSAGNQTKQTNSKGVVCWEKEYDSAGNETKWIEYRYDGSVWKRTEYEYDSAGNMIKDIAHEPHNDFEYMYEYEYDDAGNQTKEFYYTNGNIDYWIEYEYDDKGRQTGGTMYYASGSIWYIENEYDSRGKKTKRKITSSNDTEWAWESEWEYDNMGNLTKYMEYREGEIYIWREYEYITITPRNEVTVSN